MKASLNANKYTIWIYFFLRYHDHVPKLLPQSVKLLLEPSSSEGILWDLVTILTQVQIPIVLSCSVLQISYFPGKDSNPAPEICKVIL